MQLAKDEAVRRKNRDGSNSCDNSGQHTDEGFNKWYHWTSMGQLILPYLESARDLTDFRTMIRCSDNYIFDLTPFSFGCVCLPDIKCHDFSLSIKKDYLGIMHWLVWLTGQFGFGHVCQSTLFQSLLSLCSKMLTTIRSWKNLLLSLSFPCSVLSVPKGEEQILGTDIYRLLIIYFCIW